MTVNPDPAVRQALVAADFLDRLADRLDSWAAESRSGGWSTHQVAANLETANECRREAARLRPTTQSQDKP